MTVTALTFFLLYVGQDFCLCFLTIFLPQVAALDVNFVKNSCLQHCVNIYFTEP